MLPLDSTFTGRTDIWTFALQALQQRLATGYGFAAFWGSSAIQDLPEGKEWAAFASHSHNGYLDTALGMGLPGLILLHRGAGDRAVAEFPAAPIAAAMAVRWRWRCCASGCSEFISRRWRASSSTAPIRPGFTFLLAVFGLHYLARFRVRA